MRFPFKTPKVDNPVTMGKAGCLDDLLVIDDPEPLKIVQIACCGVRENMQTQCEAFIFALGSDGIVRWTDNRTMLYGAGPDAWRELPPLSLPPEPPPSDAEAEILAAIPNEWPKADEYNPFGEE